MVYWHFEVRKLIWGGNPNVEPVPLGIVSILEDLASLIKDWCCRFFVLPGWLVNFTLHACGNLL